MFSLTLTSAPANADLTTDMTTFFNSLGHTNLTNPATYQSQTAGLYTGGSLYTRAPSKNYQLLSVNLPSARVGCGGIDLWGGAFSYINEAQLVAMLRNIGQNAVGFAFNLALSTISPKTEELVNKMQAYANQINAMNINSCETAASLVGGLWPKTDEAQKQVCQSIGACPGGAGIKGASMCVAVPTEAGHLIRLVQRRGAIDGRLLPLRSTTGGVRYELGYH